MIEAQQAILSLKASIELLATCTLAAVGDDVTAPPQSATATAGGCELFVEGLTDPAAEQQRKTKRREELTKTIAALRGRRNNAGYMAKAPPHLVKETEDRLAEAESELATLA